MNRFVVLTKTPRRRRRDRRGGFLLVEALATMAISAFLLVALVSTAGLLLRASERSTAVADAGETTSHLFAALERDIGAAARVTWNDGDTTVFAGSADKLVFARDVASADGIGHTEVLTYQASTVDAGGGRTRGVLVVSGATMTPFTTGVGDLAFGPPATVYQGADIFRFSYYDRLEEGEEVVTDNWPSARRTPVAVRVAMIDPGSGTVDASVRIPLLVDAEPGCALPGQAPCSYVTQRRPTESDGAPDGALAADAGGAGDGR